MSLKRRLQVILGVAHRLLGRTALFIGVGAAGAAILIPSSEGDPDWGWVDLVRTMLFGLAPLLLPAGIAALWLMPSRAALLQAPSDSETIGRPRLLRPLLGGLSVAALLLLWPLSLWWNGGLELLARMLGPGPDPSGMSAIPATILLWVPVLASAALVAALLTSALGGIAPPPLARPVLTACVALQAGLALGSCWALYRMLGIARWLMPHFEATQELGESAGELARWMGSQESLGGAVTAGLLCLLAGHAAALIAATWLAPSPRPEMASGPEAQSSAGGAEPASGRSRPREAAADRVFDRETFVVKPRVTFFSLLRMRHAIYDIWGYGDARGGRINFSFSWSSGRIETEPGGSGILELRTRDAGWLAREYEVIDASDGSGVARLRSDRPDWEILGEGGELLARVAPALAGRNRYVARAGEVEIGRLSWHSGSMGAINPELHIEFPSEAPGSPHRAALIALGPLLEQQVRRSQRV